MQTAFLGDLILSIPTLVHLKNIFPQEEIYLVARKGVGQFLKDLKIIDQLIEVEKSNAKSYKLALNDLKQKKISRVWAPHESLRTSFFVSKISSPLKISFKNFWSPFFFDIRVFKNHSLPEALRQLSLLSGFDESLKAHLKTASLESFLKKTELGQLPPSPDWGSVSLKKQVQDLPLKMWDFNLDPTLNWIGIFPGSTWQTKKWVEEGFIELSRLLSQNHFSVVLLGSEPERDLCQRIQEQVPQSVNLAGKSSILETLFLVSKMKMVIGNDSASAHLASLVETPTLTFFGPTVLGQGFRPWGPRAYILENESLSCRPCGKHGHQHCPLGTHVCMKSLLASQAFEIVKKVLN